MRNEEEVLYPPVIWKLVDLEGSKEHKLSLEDWSEQAEEVGKSLDRYLQVYETGKSSLYQLLGCSSVFQGVLITCVAKGQSLTCRNSFPLFILSSLTIIATLAATVYLLTRISEYNDKHLIQRKILLQLHDRISGLREQGRAFDIPKALSEDLPVIPKITQKKGTLWRRLLFSSDGALLLFLVLFSGFALALLSQVLCNPAK